MWIARNKNNKLCIFESEPHRYTTQNCWDSIKDGKDDYGYEITDYSIDRQFENLNWFDKPVEIKLSPVTGTFSKPRTSNIDNAELFRSTYDKSFRWDQENR